LNLSSLTGGLAYGIPKKFLMVFPSKSMVWKPWTAPCKVVTIGFMVVFTWWQLSN